MEWLPALMLCYLLGSVPSGYIAGRLSRGIDIREAGDGNVGAANAYALLGPGPGAAVALFDISKGIIAVLMVRSITGSDAAALLGGISAAAGHSWPFYLKFRGGRGAATSLGVLLVLVPQVAAMLTIAASVPLLLYRSTTVFFACVFIPIAPLVWYTGAPAPYVGYVIALPLMIGLTHYLSTKRPSPGFAVSSGSGQSLGI